MPELPEVETVRRGLETNVVGQRVQKVSIFHPRTLRRTPGGVEQLEEMVLGAVVSAVARRGKYLWFEFGDRGALVAHLGMSGQLLVDSPDDKEGVQAGSSGIDNADLTRFIDCESGTKPVDMTVREAPVRGESKDNRHLRGQLTFDSGMVVRFIDQRTFGHLTPSELVPTADGLPGGLGTLNATIPMLLANIGRDLLDPAVEIDQLARYIKTKNTEIKRILLAQNIISGIGNIYADEALFRARIHPQRIAKNLSLKSIIEVLCCAREVMSEALEVGGTSFDALYVDVSGAPGFFARKLAVYGRTGSPCVRCGIEIIRIDFMGRGSHLCPNCQRAPRKRKPT